MHPNHIGSAVMGKLMKTFIYKHGKRMHKLINLTNSPSSSNTESRNTSCKGISHDDVTAQAVSCTETTTPSISHPTMTTEHTRSSPPAVTRHTSIPDVKEDPQKQSQLTPRQLFHHPRWSLGHNHHDPGPQ